jgi:predicted secreted protein
MKATLRSIVIGAVVLLAAGASPGRSQPLMPSDAPTLQLEASATARVPYDTANATLFVEREGTQAVEPTREVNRVIGALLAEARTLEGIDARTGQYVTQPAFDRSGKITGYRVRAELLVSSRDFARFSDALGQLSKRAPIGHIHYELSPAARTDEEERLLDAAAKAFRRKAQAAAAALGYADYSLLEMQLGSPGMPMPRAVQAMRASAAASDMAPPPIAPDLATITLTLGGRVRLEQRR